MHALNNALAGDGHAAVFTPSDMRDACSVVVSESLWPDADGIVSNAQVAEDHATATGWYSDQVMAMVLQQTFQYTLSLTPLWCNPNVLQDPEIVGAIVNKERQQHWVALKQEAGTIYLLDSQDRPRALSHDEYIQLITEPTCLAYDLPLSLCIAIFRLFAGLF